jgi:N-acyl-L-homoserine lactone synthetase
MRMAQPSVGEVGAARALKVIDLLAAEWTAAAWPITFRLATAHELDEVFLLRYRTIVEEGWARAEDFPDGRERDEFDDDAIHIVGLDGQALAATSRLVLPRARRPLPTEEAFELDVPLATGLADLGRMVVAPDYRNGNHRIFAGLLGRAWLEARSCGFDGIVGSASAAVIERYEELGVQVAILGPPRRHWGEKRFPVCLDVGATAALT